MVWWAYWPQLRNAVCLIPLQMLCTSVLEEAYKCGSKP
jgi:hypothetical protein